MSDARFSQLFSVKTAGIFERINLFVYKSQLLVCNLH